MKIKINKEKCIGCGYCDSLRPDIFSLEDDKSEVIKQPTNEESIKDIISKCPVNAITLEK